MNVSMYLSRLNETPNTNITIVRNPTEVNLGTITELNFESPVFKTGVTALSAAASIGAHRLLEKKKLMFTAIELFFSDVFLKETLSKQMGSC